MNSISENILMTQKHVVIIGAGLGGLLSGALLAKHGYKITILEKNKQIGGSLQSFGLDGKLFETAVHYIGSLAEKQTLYKIFKYLNIQDSISLKRLDSNCFDKIQIENEEYCLAQGYENFIETLSISFPHQKENLKKYIDEIKYTCKHFPLYHLKIGSQEEKQKVIFFSLKEKLNLIFSDEKIKSIICGNHLLYAGNWETIPFYIHALIQNSYIESSWKCENGSIQIAKKLEQIIKVKGGRIIRNQQINLIQETNQQIEYVETHSGEKFYADYFISNLHPEKTYQILNSSLIKKATKKRIENTTNTMGALMINISLKENSIPYKNHNIYYHRNRNIWLDFENFNENQPNSYGIFFYQDNKNKNFARGISILTYMNQKAFQHWEKTQHTTSIKSNREKEYIEKKEKMAADFICEIENIIPNLKDAIHSIDVCTPLTYRDYLNIPNGSMYGFQKDIHNLAHTTFSTRTKIQNLFLTGQNINMHGILGVSITSLLTVADLIGLEFLIHEINQS